jgi:hypothetical protein
MATQEFSPNPARNILLASKLVVASLHNAMAGREETAARGFQV